MSFLMDPLTPFDLNQSLRTCVHCRAQFWQQASESPARSLSPNPVASKRFSPAPACTCKACESKVNSSYELPAAL